MKTFKRAISCFLALLMIFGSFSVLSYADFGDGSEKSITVETKFFVNGVETDTVQAGDTVKARVYIATDFKIATTTLFWVYPLNFFKLDTSVLTSNGGNAYDVVGALNSSETSIAATANLGGFMVHQEGFVLDSMSDADNLVYEGYLTEDYFDDKGWISFTIDSGTPVVLTTDNGNEDKDDDHFAEFTFTVKDDATGEGYFYVPEESVMNTTGQDYGFTAIQRAKSDTQFMVVYNDFAYVRAYDLALNDKNTVKLGSGEVTPTEYNITYTYAGDIPSDYTAPDSIKAVTGTEVTEPEVEIPAGYKLTWTKTGDVDGKVGEADVVMTGTWSKINYNITYAYAGDVPADYEAPAATTGTIGTDVPVPADVVIPDGYKLTWDIAGDVDGKVGTEDVTVTGTWELIKYNITYVYEGEIPDDYEAPAATTGTIGTEVKAPEVTVPAGYVLNWTSAGDVDGKVGTEDVTMTGTWSLATYTIKYYLSEEDQEAGKVYKEVPYEYTAPIADFAPAAEDILGKTFAGWDIDIPMSMPAYNLEAVAMLNDIEYMVYFYNEEGDVIDSATLVKYYNETVAETDAPDMSEIEGYTFNGWVDADGEAIEFPVTVTDDVHIYSDCTVNTYKFTYYITYVGEDSEENVVFESYDVDYGEEIPAPSKDPTLEGHSFVMWDMSYAGTSMPAEDTYDVAVWDTNSYTATFKSVNGDNAGTFADNSTEKTVTDVVYGTEITFDEEPVLEGFTFQGWTDVEGGTTALTKLEMNAEGKIFYPVFTPNGEANYSVEIYLMGTDGKYADTASKTETGTGTIGVDVTVAHADYAQDAWFSADAAAANETTAVIAADGSTTFKLYYSRAKYAVTVDGVDAGEAYHDATFTAPATSTTTKTGYTLTGWTDGANNSYNVGDAITVTGALALTAVNKANDDTAYNVEIYLMGTDGKYADTASKTEIGKGTTDKEITVAHADYAQDAWFSVDAAAANETTAAIAGDGSTTFKLYYARAKYNVTVDGADAGEVYHGATFTAPATSTAVAEGYTLTGWTDGAADYEIGDEITVTGALALKAKSAANTDTAYNVEVYLMDAEGNYADTATSTKAGKGTTDVEITVDYADYAPVDAYYSADTTADGTVVTAKIAGNGSTTFKLYYARTQYTVTVEGEEPVKVYHGGTYTAPAAPTVEAGHHFVGWTDGTATYEAGAKITVTGDLALTAKTAADTDTAYIIEIYEMDENGAYGEPEKTTEYATTGTEITYTATPAEGFYTDAQSVLKVTVAADESDTIKVYYARNKYEVTVDGAKVAEVYHGGTYNAPAAPTVAEGLTFAGWKASDGKVYEAGEAITVTGALALTATTTTNEYDVIFMINDSTFASGKAAYGSAIEMGAPAAEYIPAGYNYLGWSTDGKTVITDLGTVDVGGNTFYAVLEAKTDVVYEIHKIYQNTTGGWDEPVITEEKGTTDTTVTLNAADLNEEGFTLDTENSVLSANINGDGSTDLVIKYLRNKVSVTIDGVQKDYFYGEEITVTAPSKEGNDFGGWVDEDGNTVTFPMNVPAEDIVITPVWNVKSYTVSYEDEDGTVLKAAETVEYGSTLTAPTLEDKEGMNFVGWFAKETGEEMPETMPAKNVVYVATWTEGTNTKYTIEVYMMDTNGDYSMSAATVAFGTTGSKQTIVPGAITGCSVDTAKSVLNGTIAADSSLVLKVYYARNLHTVTWLAADGSTIATENVYYGAAIDEADAPAAETGKTFAGWTPAVPATMPDEDLEFTATWADAVYTITYVINGKAEAPVEYVYGATVVPHEEPEVDGMTFKGWTPGIPATMPAENLIIVAEFEASVYKVTFLDADGEVWDVKNVQYNDEIVLPTTEPTKDYYVFTGWANVPEKMPAENITIYPEFERVPVMLVEQEGSTTVIDRENNIITGLGYRLREGTFDSKYLDVVGDGYFTVTPVEGTTNWYGTGAVIELYDNETGALLETYYVVVYGDINGDGSVSAADVSIAEDEAFAITEWSWEQTYVDGALVDNGEYDYLKKLAADLDKDGDVDTSDVANISNTSIGITAIDQTTGTVDR